MSCTTPLRWYELIPVFSYLALRGQCRSCGARIPARYALVEFSTGIVFAAVFLFVSDPFLLLLSWVLMSTLIVATVYDIDHMIIPDEVVWIATMCAVLFVGYHLTIQFDPQQLVAYLLAAAIAFAAYGGLWFISSGRWIGFGDAKLAAPLGAVVGMSGVFSLIVLSFWVGALISLAIMGGQYIRHVYPNRSVAKNGRYFTMKSEIPFAPFLIVAFVLVYVFEIDVLHLITYVLT